MLRAHRENTPRKPGIEGLTAYETILIMGSELKGAERRTRRKPVPHKNRLPTQNPKIINENNIISSKFPY